MDARSDRAWRRVMAATRKHPSIADDVKEQMRLLWWDHVSAQEISLKTGVNRNTVKSIANKNHWPRYAIAKSQRKPAPKSVMSSTQKRLAELWRTDISAPEIGVMLNMSEKQVNGIAGSMRLARRAQKALPVEQRVAYAPMRPPLPVSAANLPPLISEGGMPW
jgi:DNA-binding CsgD family transcriptional regulator